MIRALTGGLLLALVASVQGGEEVARVRTALESESPVWVGQKVSFHVDLMSSTFFSGSPHFDLPEMPGAFIVKVGGRPVLSTEQVDGATWSIQRHHFSIYPHRPGKFTVPAFPVRFAVAEAFGKPAEEQRLVSQAVQFEAKLPRGAEDLSLLISTAELEVKEVWTPPIGDGQLELEVGGAVTRQIRIRARDVPGMALPRITMTEPEGTSAYPKQPAVQDRENRGELTGERTDSVTYVCERPGTVVFPAVVIPWWDTDANELRRVRLPSVTVKVTPASATVDQQDDSLDGVPAARSRNPALVMGLLGVGVSCLLLWYFRARLRERFRVWKTRRAESEGVCFSKVKQACRSNNPIAALNALMHWLEHRAPGPEAATIESFLKRYDDPRLTDELVTLQRAVIERSPSWSGRELLARLAGVRQAGHRFPRVASPGQLPELNPTHSGTP